MFYYAESFVQNLCSWEDMNEDAFSSPNFCDGAFCRTGCTPSAQPSLSMIPSSQPSTSSQPSQSKEPSNKPSISIQPSLTNQPSMDHLGFTTTEELKNEVATYCSDPSNYDDSTYGKIFRWDVTRLTSMERVFQFERDCNPSLFNWDVSNVTNFVRNVQCTPIVFYYSCFLLSFLFLYIRTYLQSYMFHMARKFNGDIGSWNMSKATNLVSDLT